MRYKRNQIEEAIAACMGTAVEGRLRARVKRLLETDRALERDPTSNDPEAASYAFFDADPPGSGVEVGFLAFAPFALLMGIRIMGHQWPQATAVRIVRRVRPQLEAAHARILKQDRGALFEQKTLLRQAREGMIATDSTDPVFLSVVSPAHDAPEHGGFEAIAVSRGHDELMAFIRRAAPVGMATTSFEITRWAHALDDALRQTVPRKRGRGS